ncbi:MAG: transcriptional activator NhaR [Acidobacteriota bacterium]
MEWLNYQHLLYFWAVAREGSVSRACRQLSLAQPTISGQLRVLERALGEKLFRRVGRNLVLTDVGQVVYRYADEIFSLGSELVDTLKGRPVGRPLRLAVGIADSVPKMIAYCLLRPALALPEPVRLICSEDRPERLLAELSLHQLDLVLSDAPVSSAVRIRAFNHLLGECGISFFAAAPLAARYRKRFPASLEGAPFLLPSDNATLRRALDQWFDSQHIRPKIVGEFQDSALLKVFGQSGAGVFVVPTAVEDEVCRQFKVSVVGRLESIIERFYAISVERKLRHPAVVAITDTARHEVFKC